MFNLVNRLHSNFSHLNYRNVAGSVFLQNCWGILLTNTNAYGFVYLIILKNF